jgi:hypothetical protein
MKWIIVVLIVLLCSCSGSNINLVKPHPTIGNHLMIVPQGTRIGEQEAPERGLFMTDKVFDDILREVIIQTQPVKPYL